MSKRQETASEIRAAYKYAEKALRRVGRLLRTTEAGRYMWSSEHKTAVSGLCVMLDKLAYDVPDYAQDEAAATVQDDIANTGVRGGATASGTPSTEQPCSALNHHKEKGK